MKLRILTGPDDYSDAEMDSQYMFPDEKVIRPKPLIAQGYGLVNTEEELPQMRIEGLAELSQRKSSVHTPISGQ
jgi:hypothetical protein